MDGGGNASLNRSFSSSRINITGDGLRHPRGVAGVHGSPPDLAHRVQTEHRSTSRAATPRRRRYGDDFGVGPTRNRRVRGVIGNGLRSTVQRYPKRFSAGHMSSPPNCAPYPSWADHVRSVGRISGCMAASYPHTLAVRRGPHGIPPSGLCCRTSRFACMFWIQTNFARARTSTKAFPLGDDGSRRCLSSYLHERGPHCRARAPQRPCLRLRCDQNLRLARAVALVAWRQSPPPQWRKADQSSGGNKFRTVTIRSLALLT